MIPGVPSLGGTELLIILAIILLFFGAKRVPELGRSLGKGMREIRKGASGDYDNEDERREREEGKELPSRQEEELSRKEEKLYSRYEEELPRQENGRYTDLRGQKDHA